MLYGNALPTCNNISERLQNRNKIWLNVVRVTHSKPVIQILGDGLRELYARRTIGAIFFQPAIPGISPVKQPPSRFLVEGEYVCHGLEEIRSKFSVRKVLIIFEFISWCRNGYPHGDQSHKRWTSIREVQILSYALRILTIKQPLHLALLNLHRG